MQKILSSVVFVVVTSVAFIGCSGEDAASSEGDTGAPDDAQQLNGCDSASAEDHTGEGALTIATDGSSYSPSCVRISAGTRVTIASNFATHPLQAGDAATGAVDEASPIVPTDTGTSVEVAFSDAGAFGFYCQVHAPGMAGAIFVE